MNLFLPPEIERLINGRVSSGRYATPEDVVVAAVTLLALQEPFNELSTEDVELLYPGIREKIAEGETALQEGRFVDGNEFFAALEREDARRKNEDPT